MTNQIKIFVDAHCFDKEYQGARTFIKEIYSLVACKKTVQVFLGAYDIPNLKLNFPQNENIVFVQYRNNSFIRFLYDIPVIIKKNKIDYAHFQYCLPLVKNCRQILTIHDLLFKEYPLEFSFGYRFIRSILFKRSALQADMLTTVSEYSKSCMKKHFHIPEQKIYVVQNGVQNIFFGQYAKEEAGSFIENKFGVKKFILFVSRFEPRKNHISLLKVYLELELYRQGYHLVLLGHQSLKTPEFNKLLKNLSQQIRSYVLVLDQVTSNELLQFYRAAVVFVYLSKAEGFGIPPLEAAALNVPVICSNTTAMKEYSFFKSNHIDPSDSEQLKKRLVTVLNGAENKLQLKSISEHIRQKYSWEDSAEKLYRLIVHDAMNEKNNSLVKNKIQNVKEMSL